MLLNPYRFNSGGVNPNIVLQISGIGVDGSNVINDTSSYLTTPSLVGNVTTSNAQTLFGNTTLYFPQLAPLEYASNARYNISGINWVIRLWSYELTGSSRTLVSRRSTGATGWVLATSVIRALINGGWNDAQITWPRPSLNAWHHYEFGVSGNTFYVFVDGVLVGSKTGVSSIIDESQSLRFGQADNNQEDRFFGYMANIQFKTNSPPHTSNFTPPTEPFPDS